MTVKERKFTSLLKDMYGFERAKEPLKLNPHKTLPEQLKKTAKWIYRNGFEELTEEDWRSAAEMMVKSAFDFDQDWLAIDWDSTPATVPTTFNELTEEQQEALLKQDDDRENWAVWKTTAKFTGINPNGNIRMRHETQTKFACINMKNNLPDEMQNAIRGTQMTFGNAELGIGYDRLYGQLKRTLDEKINGNGQRRMQKARFDYGTVLKRQAGFMMNGEESDLKCCRHLECGKYSSVGDPPWYMDQPWSQENDDLLSTEEYNKLVKDAFSDPNFKTESSYINTAASDFRFYGKFDNGYDPYAVNQQARRFVHDTIRDCLFDTMQAEIQETYDRKRAERNGRRATAQTEKKNISPATRKAMKETTLNRHFTQVEFDNDVDLKKVPMLERAMDKLMEVLPKTAEKPSLRLRKMGQYANSGEFFDETDAIAIDFRSRDDRSDYHEKIPGVQEFLHAYGLHLDRFGGTDGKRLSGKGEFRSIARKYRENMNVLKAEDEKPAERNRRCTNTEIFANSFEVYCADKGLDSELMKTGPDYIKDLYTPFDDELTEEVRSYFDRLTEKEMHLQCRMPEETPVRKQTEASEKEQRKEAPIRAVFVQKTVEISGMKSADAAAWEKKLHALQFLPPKFVTQNRHEFYLEHQQEIDRTAADKEYGMPDRNSPDYERTACTWACKMTAMKMLRDIRRGTFDIQAETEAAEKAVREATALTKGPDRKRGMKGPGDSLDLT